MKRLTSRLIRGLILAVTMAAAAAPPAAALDLEDIGKQLGIDLDGILGKKGGKLDGFALAESILKSELPKRVGPAKRYDVKVDRAGSDLLKGRLSKVDVTGIDVRTKDGLTLPELGFTLNDVKLGLTSRRLDSVGKSDFTAGLPAEAITAFVRHRGGPRLKDAKVVLEDGEILVAANPELLGFGVPSEVAGKPVLRGTDAIDFKASKAAVFGVKLPRLALDALEKKVNPVVELSGLNVPVRIMKLAVQGERLVADGALSFGP
jgi:hypothetical protein